MLSQCPMTSNLPPHGGFAAALGLLIISQPLPPDIHAEKPKKENKVINKARCPSYFTRDGLDKLFA
jgi:hypothetical protein